MRRVIALTVVSVLAFGTAGAVAVYVRLQGNVTVADALSLAGAAPAAPRDSGATAGAEPVDPEAGRAVNLLLLGSDERDGLNGVIGGVGDVKGMRSDTAIVVHLSADRRRAELVSIPRDSLVDIPSCTMSDGSTTRAMSSEMFNVAFATGWDSGQDMASAAGCAIKTVQSLTGLTIDHFVVVDFAGFQQMVDAIGGVPICMPTDYDSEDADLHVSAGLQTFDGRTALAYARARSGTNMDGSDLQRAGRQQQLVAAMIRQILSRDVLTSAPRLITFLDAATSSLTVDPGLSRLTDMAGMALSLRSLEASDITFMTITVGEAPSDRFRVVWTSEAGPIWAHMVADEPIIDTESTRAESTPTGTSTGSTAETSTPEAPTPAPTLTDYRPGDPFTAEDTTAVCG